VCPREYDRCQVPRGSDTYPPVDKKKEASEDREPVAPAFPHLLEAVHAMVSPGPARHQHPAPARTAAHPSDQSGPAGERTVGQAHALPVRIGPRISPPCTRAARPLPQTRSLVWPVWPVSLRPRIVGRACYSAWRPAAETAIKRLRAPARHDEQCHRDAHEEPGLTLCLACLGRSSPGDAIWPTADPTYARMAYGVTLLGTPLV
jgi:hypothetical protein